MRDVLETLADEAPGQNVTCTMVPPGFLDIIMMGKVSNKVQVGRAASIFVALYM
jgi:hypothetical protein